MLGIMPVEQAIKIAKTHGLDLVEVSPNAEPPVCKIINYGKYKYELQKKANDARKKQKVISVKEIKLRPNIEDNDYEVKKRSVIKFLKEGDKVKVTLKFRGREITHQEYGMNLLNRLLSEVEALVKPEQLPRMEGKQIVMVLAPK